MARLLLCTVHAKYRQHFESREEEAKEAMTAVFLIDLGMPTFGLCVCLC